MKKESPAPITIPSAYVNLTSGQERQMEAAKNRIAKICTPSFVVTGRLAENVGTRIAKGFTHWN